MSVLPGLLAACFLLQPAVAGEPQRYGLGRIPDSAEIRRWDIDVSPDGAGLPAGQGTVMRGERVYRDKCQACHGTGGTGGPNDTLVERFNPDVNFARDPEAPRTIGSFWPYATTLYDYINRAMPFDRPGTLTADEIYSVIAWLLYRNGIIEPDTVIDADTLPAIEMPARVLFYPGDEVIR